jgi:beta-N-acetylhexosaminidase
MARREDIEKAVGRLLLARLPALDLIDSARLALGNGTIGGIVLFKENGSDVEQLAGLNQDIIEASHHNPIIAVDQEGGAIQRFDHFLSSLPSPMAVAATNDLTTAREIAAISAKQLKVLGINCILTPVLDVLTNARNPIIATRAFSDNPKTVSDYAKEVFKAIEDCGIVAVGKHFPGHGATREDSHTDLAVNPADSRSLWQVDLVPFRNCIGHMKSVLTAHVWLSAVDEEPLPASLSKRVTQGILREYLKFDGVIMTDDLTMKAITKKWGLEEAALMCLLAGNDIAMVCASIEETLSVHKHIVKAVEDGRISEEQIRHSKERVDKVFGGKSKVPDAAQVKNLKAMIKKDSAKCLQASKQAICTLRGSIPEITDGEWILVVPRHPRYPMNLLAALSELSAKKKTGAPKGTAKLQFKELRYSLNPTEAEIEELGRQCRNRNVILLTYRTLLNEFQGQLGGLIGRESRSCIAVATDVPFDFHQLPELSNFIASFDPSEQAMYAIASALLKLTPATGVCPVNLAVPIVSR